MELHKQSQQLRRLMAARKRNRGAEGLEMSSLASGRAAEGAAGYGGTAAVESRLGANDTSGDRDATGATDGAGHGASSEREVSDREAALVEELEALRVQVQAKDATLRDVTEELEEAQEEAREGKRWETHASRWHPWRASADGSHHRPTPTLSQRREPGAACGGEAETVARAGRDVPQRATRRAARA